jgi:two-component system nitrogen regulation response regulator GlnG/two-component system response regulator HydG
LGLRSGGARAARSGLHVLVRGESGAGKEAVARALHRLSSRAKGPFISHNGAGLSETLAQAEIFGNEKNFPNPPMEAHAGLVGEAHGGVLYLDEIGELPPEVQAMLLRVLDQGGQYRRLGESRNRTSDFLMVGATNSSLEGARRDFVARFLATIPVPALREHAEDIPLLAQPLAIMLLASNADQTARFIEERPDGSRYVRISPDLLEALMLAEHPVNVRGLAAYLWRAMGTSKGSWIRPSRELIEELRRPSPAGPGGFLTPEGRMRELTPDEQQALRRRIDGSTGCVARAAAAMGVSRHQLRRALKRYGILEPRGDDDDR